MIDRLKSLELAEIYFTIRLTEERIAKEYPKGEMRCPVHLSLGQELFPAILGSLMEDEDFAISSHRSHAHYLAKKGSLESFVAELYGKESGCSKGRGGSMHLIDLNRNFLGSTAIVANSIPVGVGAAASIKFSGVNSHALCFIFFGDGAVEEGVFSESLNIAILQNLPTVFVCENNAFSVYTHLSCRQPESRNIFEWARGFGVRSERIDSLDIEDSYNKLGEIIAWSRDSAQPIFLELPSWREVEHCGPNNDDDLGYRSNQEIKKWKNRDITAELRQILIKNHVSEKEIESLTEGIEQRINVAFSLSEQDKAENACNILRDVYA